MTLSHEIAQHLPFLRRYARALTGSQASGDAYVRATLEAISENPDRYHRTMHPRVALYRLFHVIWSGTRPARDVPDSESDDRFRTRLDALSAARRQALLLTAMENFSPPEVAQILDRAPEEISKMVAEALYGLVAQTPISVLIIEDEPIISMDLSNIVEEMGHTVANVVRTRREAVEAAAKSAPGLIVADIQLADNSSGIDAVRDILADLSVPVIFVTAYPERLLTGERPEPTFLVSKPFATESVKVTIAQALLLAEDRPGA
ncbi:MAG: response regulator [Rhodospirillaceae bacterium]|nr:response regulator [Rhodospirillaceae bacterium]